MKYNTCLNERWVHENVPLAFGAAGEEDRSEENVLLSLCRDLRPKELLELLDGAPFELRWEPRLFKPRAEDRRGVSPETVDMRRADGPHRGSDLGVVWDVRQYGEI